MLRFIITSCLFAVAFGGAISYLAEYDGRIVGGENATIEEFPYQVSLRHFSIPICGGSILNEHTILTAAHCTDDKTPKYMSIRAGSTSKETGGQVIKVAEVIQHEKYNRLTKDYDLSILKLEEPLVFGEGVASIDLQEEGVDVPAGTDAVITGWGRLASNNSDSPEYLRKVTVTVITREECKKKYTQNPVTDRMFCCTSGGKDSCQGDSGGPLAANGKQIGVVSWGKGCGNGRYPGVYARVSLLRPWIDQHASA